MKYEEIENLLQYHDKESKIFMPNEIFTDLKGAITNSSPHLAFSYSYTYLITWIYRHAKHMSKDGIIDNGKLKEILGYNPTTKGLDYLIKKNGLLDQLGYTETVKDFPTSWTFDDGDLEFDMYSDNKEMLTNWNLPRKYSIKYPVKSFHRFDEEVEDGTFYEFTNTHCIPFEVFMYCMDNEQIGTIGFYLYSYIKRMNDMYVGGWDISIEKMINEISIPLRTLISYLDVLRKYKMIDVKYNQEFFALAIRLEDRKANTYIANEFQQFTDKPQTYDKMKVLKMEEYKKVKKEEYIEKWGKKAHIPLEQLPY